MNKKKSQKILIFQALVIYTFILMAFLPKMAGAVTTTETFGWGRGKTAFIKEKIDELPLERVANLKIPILFGVSLGDLYNSWGDRRPGGRRHQGIDIMAPKGAFIISPTEAVVTRIDYGLIGGNVVYTVNPGRETFYYAHLSAFRDGLKVGDVLEAGDLIGYVGNTGDARFGAPHLHFTIYDSTGPRNPFLRLKEEFSIDEKAQSVRKIIAEAKDPDELIATLKDKYKDVMKIALSKKVKSKVKVAEETKEESDTEVAVVTNEVVSQKGEALSAQKLSIKVDLREGATGKDVVALQKFLIQESKGPHARTLAAVSTLGKFGPLTKKALAEYQKSVGISPAVGIFGPKTRAFIAERNLPVVAIK